MFSGIVEASLPVSLAVTRSDVLELHVQRPPEFNDLKIGDSVSVNGVCLTVESLTTETMIFAVGPETLRVTGWSQADLVGQKMNLERSLKFGDRVHGHLVTGHIDGMARVVSVEDTGETRRLQIEVGDTQIPFIWHKGSITLNGVSLTVNEVHGHLVGVWLIPETLKRTNLGVLKIQNFVLVEVDMYAKALQQNGRQNSRPYVEDRI